MVAADFLFDQIYCEGAIKPKVKKTDQTVLDTTPIPGLFFVDGDIHWAAKRAAGQFQGETEEKYYVGMKFPMISLPSGEYPLRIVEQHSSGNREICADIWGMLLPVSKGKRYAYNWIDQYVRRYIKIGELKKRKSGITVTAPDINNPGIKIICKLFYDQNDRVSDIQLFSTNRVRLASLYPPKVGGS